LCCTVLYVPPDSAVGVWRPRRELSLARMCIIASPRNRMLQDLSNFCCLPGRAGGSPCCARNSPETAHPEDLGLGFTTWSLPKLEEYLRQQPGLKHLARSTIRRRLHHAGLRYRAGQTWCLSTDPDFEVKKTKW